MKAVVELGEGGGGLGVRDDSFASLDVKRCGWVFTPDIFAVIMGKSWVPRRNSSCLCIRARYV